MTRLIASFVFVMITVRMRQVSRFQSSAIAQKPLCKQLSGIWFLLEQNGERSLDSDIRICHGRDIRLASNMNIS
ncbi:hypothetical protein HPC62_13665 [Thermoleptolyngbya sichuanensis A183]|uniref:Uncharacterized protein n=1 Tax=Thermoleptolyngbya sichuanensis A183 TaxID=2737172 RepID=A0A6M8B9F2_9CYAN|nr:MULTISPECIES: hypothetical protein [Thermoleptolyngbya]QKD83098.1 hypothetical protein HPC62_13665 [Thermoleptolyngbya sichuanensis A183]